ncbi:MAG: nucleotidyltransferase family protein [Pirellulales bacterium]
MQTFAVIPAAGRSQRMGQPKLLLPWGTSTVIEQVLAAWRSSQVDHTVMVVHPDDAELAELARACGALVVRADAPPPQMKASIRLGLAEISRRFTPADRDAWLLAPADMPALSSEVIDRLIEAHRALAADLHERPTIWAAAAGGRRGHPVLFPWSLAKEVEQLAADEGLNALVARHRVRTIEADASAVLQDLDTPEDYQRLRPADGA